jgi:hypothetical protein
MTPGRGDFLSLVERLIDLLSKLFTERVALARGELQESARRAGRRASLGLAGALLCAVGLAFLGAAAVDALAPLVKSVWLRCLLVSLPFVASGAWLISRAGSDRLAGAAPDDRDHDREQRQHQEDVRPGTERVAEHQP